MTRMAAYLNQESSIHSFSGLILLSYILSSLVMGPYNQLTDAKNFTNAHRCKKNSLLFIPEAFKFENNRVIFNHSFTTKTVQRHFPSFIPNIDVERPTTAIAQNQELMALQSKLKYVYPKNHLQRINVDETLRLYKQGQINTQRYANQAIHIFKTKGLTLDALLQFYQLYWDEYFSILNRVKQTQRSVAIYNASFVYQGQGCQLFKQFSDPLQFQRTRN